MSYNRDMEHCGPFQSTHSSRPLSHSHMSGEDRHFGVSQAGVGLHELTVFC